MTDKLYQEAHKDYCLYCESYLEQSWRFCPNCGKKRTIKLATKLGGAQPLEVRQKISKSIKEFWVNRRMRA